MQDGRTDLSSLSQPSDGSLPPPPPHPPRAQLKAPLQWTRCGGRPAKCWFLKQTGTNDRICLTADFPWLSVERWDQGKAFAKIFSFYCPPNLALKSLALASLVNILAQCWDSLIEEPEAQPWTRGPDLGQSRTWPKGGWCEGQRQRSKLSCDALAFMKGICVGLSHGWEKRKNK